MLDGKKCKYRLYLEDTIKLILEDAQKTVLEKNEAQKDSPDYTYLSGKAMAYLEVIALLQDQTRSFQIDLKELGLDNIDPENDLI